MSGNDRSWNVFHRPRRLRRVESLRQMVRETRLAKQDLIAPLFLVEGHGVCEEISSMPGQYRRSLDRLIEEVSRLQEVGLSAIALFPAISEKLKDPFGKEGLNPQGLFPEAIRQVKRSCPDVLIVSDVALDPYSSDGHDGVVRKGVIENDETLDILSKMALMQAEAGADIVAPSDMMDGRVGMIRSALDQAGYHEVSLLSYTAKYASSLYGPFRDALDSAPRKREGVPENKKSYQMDPGNVIEALREAELDMQEGADMLMVKPAGMYLDVIRRVKEVSRIPLAAYQVSGEYAMIQAAAQKGYLNLQAIAMESVLAIKRSGADLILTYFASEIARWIDEQ